jgi:hypothetical protein
VPAKHFAQAWVQTNLRYRFHAKLLHFVTKSNKNDYDLRAHVATTVSIDEHLHFIAPERSLFGMSSQGQAGAAFADIFLSFC